MVDNTGFLWLSSNTYQVTPALKWIGGGPRREFKLGDIMAQRRNHYLGLAADYSRVGLVPDDTKLNLIKLAEDIISAARNLCFRRLAPTIQQKKSKPKTKNGGRHIVRRSAGQRRYPDGRISG